MARKVYISSEMSVDESISEIAEINPTAALMWPWVLTYFDDWGRAKASPREIKNSVFPANELITTSIIENAIDLYDGKMITVYEVDGKKYMCIDPDKWFKYQTHIRKEKRENDGSKHPAPIVADSAQVRASARSNAQISDNLTNCIPSPSPSPSLSKTDIYKDSIKENLDKYNIKIKGIYDLEQLEAYEGMVDLDVMLEAIKLSENKNVAYVKSVIDSLKDKKTDGRPKGPKSKAAHHSVGRSDPDYSQPFEIEIPLTYSQKMEKFRKIMGDDLDE